MKKSHGKVLSVSEPDITAPYGNLFCDEITGMEFVWVPGGSFYMGDVFGDHKGDDISDIFLESALPVHRVTLKGFYLGKYPVTQGEWQKIMGDIPEDFRRGGGDRHPAGHVIWDDAHEFIRRLNKKSGKNYSLPSEAQWEYAARECGKKVRFGTGKNTITTNEANYEGNFDDPYSSKGEYRGGTTPVDNFPPNALGLYDMSGNVWEWCQDLFNDNYEGAPSDGSAWETGGDGVSRVCRGGSWDDVPGYLRVASRSPASPLDDECGDCGAVGLRLLLAG